MKYIRLSKGYSALVDDEDFERLSVHTWHALVRRRRSDGMVTCVYAKRRTYDPATRDRTVVYMHREALCLAPGRKPEVDHRDNDGLNNQKANLRLATRSQQLRNTRLRSDNSSGHKGVNWDRKNKRWKAEITVNRRNLHLGRHVLLEDAIKAYEEAAKKYSGEFAKHSQPCVEYANTNAVSVGD